MRQITAFAFMTTIIMSAGVPAHSQISAPELIATSIPDQWRAAFEKFLGELGDRKAMIEKTSAFQIGGLWRPDSILFRIEEPALCSDDLCFTLIGRIANNKLQADAMFVAGKRFTSGDQFIPLFGFQTTQVWLIGDKVTVKLIETPEGWIVAATPNSMTTPP